MHANKWTKSCLVKIPPRTIGAWSVHKVRVSKHNEFFGMLTAAAHGNRRFAPAGWFTRLTCDSETVMSDTPDECLDHYEFISEARRRGGYILISGLGLGMAAAAILHKPVKRSEGEHAVKRITILEIAPEVIQLVGPTLRRRFGGRIEIIQADANNWSPPKGAHYSCVYHDIWNTISVENLPSMAKLNRRYARFCDWQDCWGQSIARRDQRESRRQRYG